MNAKYHCKSKTKINSDRRKNVKSDNNCSVIEGTLSGYFVLKAQDTLDYVSALLNSAELPLSSKSAPSPEDHK